MTTRESRDRVEGERASKPEGEREGNTGHQREVPEVRSDPVRAKRHPPPGNLLGETVTEQRE